MLNRNASLSKFTVLFVITLAAVNKFSTSFVDPQNCVDPFPNSLRDVFLLTYAEGLIGIFVNPGLGTDRVKSRDVAMTVLDSIICEGILGTASKPWWRVYLRTDILTYTHASRPCPIYKVIFNR